MIRAAVIPRAEVETIDTLPWPQVTAAIVRVEESIERQRERLNLLRARGRAIQRSQRQKQPLAQECQ